MQVSLASTVFLDFSSTLCSNSSIDNGFMLARGVVGQSCDSGITIFDAISNGEELEVAVRGSDNASLQQQPCNGPFYRVNCRVDTLSSPTRHVGFPASRRLRLSLGARANEITRVVNNFLSNFPRFSIPIVELPLQFTVPVAP